MDYKDMTFKDFYGEIERQYEKAYQEDIEEFKEWFEVKVDQFVKKAIIEKIHQVYIDRVDLYKNHQMRKIDIFLKKNDLGKIVNMSPKEIIFRATDE